MCGIAGYAGSDHPQIGRNITAAMTRAMSRRGPDSQGIESWPGCVLGHRRLAVIDTSPMGHQPMLSDDRRTGLVFNGCIYNFQELRVELEALGHSFLSRCDTEVLLRGYEEWGIDKLVSRLRGMFAFAIWDDARRVLTLVRDRLGVKPLVYAVKDGTIAFASTVAALRSAGLVDEVDRVAVLEFLEFGYVTDDRTIFQGASKLAAATILEWSEGAISERRYWTLPQEYSASITFEEALEETERLLLESVKLRLCSDVPIGALLSGGIDSTLVCWATAKLNANIRAFTVGTPGDRADESVGAVETARALGIPHELVTLPLSEGEIVSELTAAYGEPFACQSALAMLQVSAAVKGHATVLLTGDGGDDVFLGYPFHRDFFRAEKLANLLPRHAASAWKALRSTIEAIPALRRPGHFIDYATGGLGAIVRAHDGLPWYRDMLGERLIHCELAQRNIPLSFASARNLLEEFLDYQQRMWFVAEFMTKVDGGTMYHSIEARSPFLDHKLWDFAATIPPAIRLRGGLKAILREIVRRRVSPATAARKKQGFTIPVERWLRGQWSEALDRIQEGSRLEQNGWIRRGTLKTRIEEARRRGDFPRQIWFLVVLENWLRANEEVGLAEIAG